MFDTGTHRYGKTSTVNHVPHAVENLSSTFNPQYCQIPGSKGEPNRSVGLEFGRNVTGARPTWQVYSQQGKNMGRGKWDLCIPGGYWGGWRRCCHPPVRFPLCILGLCPSCAPLTSLMGAKAIIDPCMCVCVCVSQTLRAIVAVSFVLILWLMTPQQTGQWFERDYYHTALLFMGFSFGNSSICLFLWPGKQFITWETRTACNEVGGKHIIFMSNTLLDLDMTFNPLVGLMCVWFTLHFRAHA